MEAGKTRDMNTFTLAEIALNFPHSIKNLIHYDLDFCCNGKTSFVKACEAIDLNADQIWNEIIEQDAKIDSDSPMHFITWDPGLLINFIIQHHHDEVKKTIPHISELLDKVCNVHGEDNGFLIAVREDFEKLSEQLMHHFPKEEEILFATIRTLFNRGAEKSNRSAAQDDLAVLITVIEQEHERAGGLLKSIRTLTSNYEPPAFACPTLRMTYVMLNQFDTDLMQRIHIENNILLPKVKG